MKLKTPLLATCLIAALGPALVAQNEVPVPPKFGGGAPTEKPDGPGPLLASDGQPVTPGRIPSDTTKAAKDRWEKVLAATRVPGLPAAPIEGFDMQFEVQANGNEFDAHYRFKAKEGYLYFRTPRSKRVMLRGPKGDYLIDEGVAEKLGGRGNQVGPKQLDEWTSIARNFIALTNPKAMRIVSLKTLAGMTLPMPELRDDLTQLAKHLTWLEVRSPDFRLYDVEGPGKHTEVFRALLGLNQETGAVELAVLSEDHKQAGLHYSTMLVEIPRRNQLNGYVVPGRLKIYKVQDGRGVVRKFEKYEAVDLSLKEGGSLRPTFDPKVFEPPPG